MENTSKNPKAAPTRSTYPCHQAKALIRISRQLLNGIIGSLGNGGS